MNFVPWEELFESKLESLLDVCVYMVVDKIIGLTRRDFAKNQPVGH